MCTNPQHIKVPTNAIEQRRTGAAFKYVDVPCGKCFECLSVRQNQLSLRCAREAEFKGSCQFLTLTYSEDRVPLSISPWLVEKETGEYRRLDVPEILMDSNSNTIRSDFFKDGLNVHDFLYKELDNYLQIWRVTRSLNYDDVRLWIKLARVRFEREYGHKMSDFTYCIVGEYGQRNTRRPHYHCLFFGMNNFEVSFMANLWTSKQELNFGYSYIENDIPVTSFGKVAQYLGKYCAKGPFDNPSVRQGLTVKSRLCTSKYLGVHLSTAELAFFRCSDLFKYDVHQSSFPAELFPVMRERLYLTISGLDGYKFKLPRSIVNTVFDNRLYNGKISHSSLWYAYTDYIRDTISAEAEREFTEFISQFPPEDISKACTLFEFSKQSALQAREQARKENIKRKLRSSVF